MSRTRFDSVLIGLDSSFDQLFKCLDLSSDPLSIQVEPGVDPFLSDSNLSGSKIIFIGFLDLSICDNVLFNSDVSPISDLDIDLSRRSRRKITIFDVWS